VHQPPEWQLGAVDLVVVKHIGNQPLVGGDVEQPLHFAWQRARHIGLRPFGDPPSVHIWADAARGRFHQHVVGSISTWFTHNGILKPKARALLSW
jgi:hypothetical protein